MNRAAHFLLIVMAIGLMAAPPARAETGSAASQIPALRRELRNLAASNQRQINGLQAQVRALSSALAKSRAEPATGLRVAETPAPSAPPSALPVEPRPEGVPRARMPMLPPEMANLPGRSVLSPYTAAGSGAPGPSPVTPAAAMSSGGNRVMLSLSGQVDRALLYGDDGHSSNLRQVDNNNSSTRFRIVGEAAPFADNTVAGINLETEIRPNSSATQTLTQNLPQPASAVTFTIRQAEIYGGNPQYGEVRLGFGSTASYLTTEGDLSRTAGPRPPPGPHFTRGLP